MARKYEVHIDGKVLIIGELPNFGALPRNWLALHVDSSEEIAGLVRVLVVDSTLQGAYAFSADVERLWHWFCQGYTLVQAAGGAVTSHDGRLLAIHRLGRWDLPKGKVERGESIEEAALREVREECGLRHLRLIRPLLNTWHTYERNGPQLKCTHWFLMEGDATEQLHPQAEEAIDAVRWLDAPAVEEMRGDTYASVLAVLNAWSVVRHGRA